MRDAMNYMFAVVVYFISLNWPVAKIFIKGVPGEGKILAAKGTASG